jgi:hypothetical protein
MEPLKPQEYIEYIKRHAHFIEANAEKLRIYEGDLMPFLDAILKKRLAENYYKQIKDSIVPINILPRIIDKMAKAYLKSPERIDEDQQALKEAEFYLDVDAHMNMADEFANLFKAYAIELFEEDGYPNMRVLPFDRFLPMGRDRKNPLKVTDFIKFMGKVSHNGKDQNLYHVYTDTHFLPILEDEAEPYYPDMEGNDGINPLGRIPFVYGNRSRQHLIPVQDTDLIQMTKVIPVTLTDLGGAVMFQCFSVIYGINLQAENLTFTPNAFWSFKSDPIAQTPPQIGTIKPEVDVDKVLNFIHAQMSMLLETKGLRVGAMGTTEGAMNPSGISKMIDEADTSDIIDKSKKFFIKEEKDLWDLYKLKNNYWVKNIPEYKLPMLADEFEPETIFYKKPEVEVIDVVDTQENLDTETIRS